jgi:hypothetical protein
MTYAHHDPNYPNQHPHNWQPSPQELPVTNASTASSSPRPHKSINGHGRGPSELSGDQARSELESVPGSTKGGSWRTDKRKSMYPPIANPRSPEGPSPIMSPMIEDSEQANTGVGSPVSPPMQGHKFVNQETTGTMNRTDGEDVTTQSWMAPQAWSSPTHGPEEGNDVRNGEVRGGAHGLGVLEFLDGLDGNRERLDDQRAERRQSPRARAYPGAF